ncbi:helix-turn-helix transcriptional regulator [Aminobacter anthyllidis]|uniref:Helix-turn-helix transcriptional regulator n=1 Tax=Aminobacter anthyllidis TaxID=1035067 RepID=A0A9X1AHF7_9HYPH|nr:helix-turn-helix transcriptional regulator [Aminobacter anthyllidis]MBT1159636.1 helix-turn-helix transcriptional regulator [Aminobacter anthyllidis]
MEDQDHRKAIAARLKEARRLSGLSQGQVAQQMNLHRPSVSEIEAGNRRVSAEELSHFAKIYDVSVAYLVGDAPDTLAVNDPRLQLAARELQKLSPDSLNKLLKALAALRAGDDEGAN